MRNRVEYGTGQHSLLIRLCVLHPLHWSTSTASWVTRVRIKSTLKATTTKKQLPEEVNLERSFVSILYSGVTHEAMHCNTLYNTVSADSPSCSPILKHLVQLVLIFVNRKQRLAHTDLLRRLPACNLNSEIFPHEKGTIFTALWPAEESRAAGMKRFFYEYSWGKSSVLEEHAL